MTVSLSNWQMQANGLTLGPGTPFGINNVQGLGQPDRRTGDQPRPLNDGDFIGTDFYASRQVIIDLTIKGTSAWDGGSVNADKAVQARANLSALSLAWRGSPTLYIAQPSWGTRALVGRPRRLKADDLSQLKVGVIPVSLEYYSPYPAMFSDTATVGAAPSISGGMVLPSAPPWTFGTVVTGRTCTVTNSGDYAYSPVVRLHGPFTTATVTRASDSATFALSLATLLASGDYITIDMDARTIVRHSDSANMRRYLTSGSTWLTFPPGTDTLTLSTDTTSLGPYIDADTRSAWLA